jgi:hypothetical protein
LWGEGLDGWRTSRRGHPGHEVDNVGLNSGRTELPGHGLSSKPDETSSKADELSSKVTGSAIRRLLRWKDAELVALEGRPDRDAQVDPAAIRRDAARRHRARGPAGVGGVEDHSRAVRPLPGRYTRRGIATPAPAGMVSVEFKRTTCGLLIAPVASSVALTVQG